ncbi:MAG: 2-oxoglutarate dehydrogenase E1 subunit family protein, partial [Planctomycetaceae bacterium]
MGQLADRLNSQSLAFVEDLYANYLTDPHSVSAEWREHFEGWRQAEPASVQPKLAPTFRRRSLFHGGNGRTRDGAALLTAPDQPILQERVDQLIRNYRVRGHMVAKVDPLGQQTQQPIELDPAFYGLTEADFHREFSTTSIGGPEVRTLREIIRRLRNTYCRSIGVQFMHIDSQMVRSWLQDRMEAAENRIQLTRNEQVRIFTRLNDAVLFEEFIQKKFIGAKSFSLEGAESLIPLLHLAFEKAGQDGIEEIVIGMAHRGRLNVLANIMGKNPRQIFREFEDRDPELHFGKGDVKYHLGYSHDWKTSGGRKVHLSLCFNPSHLEFVNPVVVGRVRAKQDRAGDKERQRGMALLIHGDA